MLLRAAKITGIDFSSFQDDFDLDQYGGPPKNNFHSVAEKVKERYPFVEFCCESFPKGDGNKKLERIEELISHKQLLLVSLANEPSGGQGWHIMPVVGADTENLFLLHSIAQDGEPVPQKISKKDFVQIHDKFLGGDEIAYLADILLPNKDERTKSS